MPGSGKSTLGKQLAEKLDVPFVDLDQQIEEEEGMPIPEIFSTKGEDYFRLVESQNLLGRTASESSFVLATGGGAPCFHDGINHMNASGLTVYLQVSITELVERTARRKHRPLLVSENNIELRHRLESLLQKREAIYQKAKIIVSNPSVDLVLERIRTRM